VANVLVATCLVIEFSVVSLLNRNSRDFVIWLCLVPLVTLVVWGIVSAVCVAALTPLWLGGVWATYHFYQHRMRVIWLVPQDALITTTPHRISRKPLYLGGNVLIFLGAVTN
jgi:hypothetical protein